MDKNKAQHLKVGIDFHGVITAIPDFFRKFNQTLLEQGHLVYILSGGSRQDVREFLQEHEIPYSVIWSIKDYFAAKNKIKYFPNGSFKVEDSLWDNAKAKYCQRKKIDFHIDDSKVYGREFKTPYCHYDAQKHHCVVGKKEVFMLDLQLPPAVVVKEILRFLEKK